MQLLYLTMKQQNGRVDFTDSLDFSMFEQKADTYDKSASSKSIERFFKEISAF